jgi:hypothetical protein
MAGNETQKRPDRRWLGLRGLMALVALIALVLVATLPLFSERLRFFERYVRVRLNEDDMNRHADVASIRHLAEGFAKAIRSGRLEEALEMTTAAFRARTTSDQLRALAAEVGLDQGPCELIEATCAFPEGVNRFVSEYSLRCGPSAGPSRPVKLIVITEGGRLKVDRVEGGPK